MMQTSLPSTDRIAVIVVNYGTAELSIAAVESVLAGDHSRCAVEVHLLDNASPGNDAARFQTAHAEKGWGAHVRRWLEAENHGFGRGNNVVLHALAKDGSPPDKVFLLNPDARLHNEAVDILAHALEANPEAGAAGAAVLREDLSPAIAAFRFPGAKSELARLLSFGPFDRLVARHLVALPPDQPAGPVDWVSGAAVMFRFEAVAKIGFFDPGFFLYYEEVDLMRRLQDSGWHTLYVPEAQVVHVEGAATGQFAAKETRKPDPWYLYQSWAHYFRRAYGRGRALSLALALWPAACFNLVHRGLRGKAPSIPKRFFSDHWRYVVWPLIRGK